MKKSKYAAESKKFRLKLKIVITDTEKSRDMIQDICDSDITKLIQLTKSKETESQSSVSNIIKYESMLSDELIAT